MSSPARETLVLDDPAAAAAERIAGAVDAVVRRRALCCSASGRTATAPRCSLASPLWEERERLVVALERPGLAPWVSRVTLTLPLINAAREVLFLATGAEKAQAAARLIAEPAGRELPASLVAPASGALTVLLDHAAAAGPAAAVS